MAASAGDVRAGAAYYEMYARDGQLTLAVARARATVAAFSSFVKSLPVVGGPFAALTDQLAPLQGAAQKAGGVLQTAFHGAAGALVRVRDLLKGAGAAAGALGVAIGGPLLALFKGATDRAGDLARLNRQLGLPIETLNKFQYAAERAGVSLDEVFGDFTGRYSDLIAQAPSINPDDARAAAAAQKDLADATRAVQDALLPLVRIVAPVVKQVAEWVKRNAALVAVLAPVAGGLVAVGAAAGAAALAVSGLLAVSGIALKILGGVAAVVTSPFTLAAVAVAGLTYAWAANTESGRAATEQLRTGLAPAVERVKGVVGALAAALQKGDLQGALAVGGAALEAEWAGALKHVTGAWNEFKATVGEEFYDVFGGLGPVIEVAMGVARDAFRWLKDEALATVDDVVQGWKRLTSGIGQAVADVRALWERFGPSIMRALEPIKPFLVGLFAPVVLAVELVKAAWDGLDKNIAVTLTRLTKTVVGAWAWVTGTIENAFKGVARAAIKAIQDVLEKLGPLAAKTLGIDASGLAETLGRARAAVGDDVNVRDQVAAARAAYDLQEQIIRKQEEAAKKARAEGREADAEAADRRAAEAERNLKGAADGAHVPGAKGADPGGVLRPNLLPDVSTKGQFGGGDLAQSLGYADKAQQQTELLRAINDTLKANPEAVAKAVAPVIAGIWSAK